MTIGTGVQLLPREEPRGYLSTALVVVRHEGGASSVWALARNVGTPRCDGAGRCVLMPVDGRENPKQLICEGESTDARQGDGPGTDRLVGAVMPGNAGGAKGAGCPGSFGGQPGCWEEPGERIKVTGETV